MATREDALSPSDPSLLEKAKQARQLRAAMSKLGPRELFVDPAWDMMLELFIAAEQKQQLCVKDLILLSGESSTSALRRIDRLQGSELITRQVDRTDHRRVRVALTPQGWASMAAMLEHLFDPPATREAPARPATFRPHHPRD
ncbi:MarR family transcriptional regulator [Sphingomonas jatrophae]|uniref:Winged helix DNA-binding domain-containing protein n=1 Tax=Sphingomonas jatrophae TaxID=1166337 RepID=A0A1I6JAY5_9SPHN|nr:MarR family transcriptional regulator [Sphingomonas jatrophae]SFR76183.1 Winged helix DNA-binding domain-containing protein [Sphingomonas jatrophae]